MFKKRRKEKKKKVLLLLYLTTCKDDRRPWGFGSVWDGHSFWWRLEKQKYSPLTINNYVKYQCPEPIYKIIKIRITLNNVCTSSMTMQICLTHSIMDCGVPATVMARSVELGNMSPATCTWAPADYKVTARITTPIRGKQQQQTKPTTGSEIHTRLKYSRQTSLISLILQPPLPMSEPHWLAGTTRRMVTGGLLVAVLLVIEVLMSCRGSGYNRRL